MRRSLTRGTARRRPTAPPILLYGEGKDVNEFDHWGAFAKRPGVREVRSPERLLEQASFCLHRELASMPDAHRAALQGAARRERGAAGQAR